MPAASSWKHVPESLIAVLVPTKEDGEEDENKVVGTDLAGHGGVGVEELEDLGLSPGLLDEALHLLPDLGVVLVDEPEEELALLREPVVGPVLDVAAPTRKVPVKVPL